MVVPEKDAKKEAADASCSDTIDNDEVEYLGDSLEALRECKQCSIHFTQTSSFKTCTDNHEDNTAFVSETCENPSPKTCQFNHLQLCHVQVNCFKCDICEKAFALIS